MPDEVEKQCVSPVSLTAPLLLPASSLTVIAPVFFAAACDLTVIESSWVGAVCTVLVSVKLIASLAPLSVRPST